MNVHLSITANTDQHGKFAKIFVDASDGDLSITVTVYNNISNIIERVAYFTTYDQRDDKKTMLANISHHMFKVKSILERLEGIWFITLVRDEFKRVYNMEAK